MNQELGPISAQGFVEREYLITGTASRYREAASPNSVEQIDSGHPYTTRLLVRSPRDSGRFNGSVVVEWLNVSTGQDVDFVYASTRELVLRQGFAWVGASVQRVGVESLVAWNPQRYAGLSVAAPLDDPATGKPVDPERTFVGAAGGDVLCWSIYSQVAQVIRANQVTLFGAEAVTQMIAAGESQSAFRLTRYFNEIQPLHGLYDGFLLYDRGGPEELRTDVDSKAISIGTDFMAEYAGGSPPIDGDNQRWWELAGSSHV